MKNRWSSEIALGVNTLWLVLIFMDWIESAARYQGGETIKDTPLTYHSALLIFILTASTLILNIWAIVGLYRDVLHLREKVR